VIDGVKNYFISLVYASIHVIFDNVAHKIKINVEWLSCM